MRRITNKSKKLIIVSTVMSALLIITAVAWYMYAGGSGDTQGKGFVFIFLAIVLLAVLATAVLIYSRLKRTEYTKELSGEYFEAYESVRDAVGNSNLTISERKEVLSDVAVMLYYAQTENRSAKNVVGDDALAFAEKVKHSFGYTNSAAFFIIDALIYLIMIMCLLQVVNFFAHEEAETFFEATIGISIIPYMVALSFLVVPLMRRSIAKKKRGWTFILPLIFVVIYIAVNEILYRVNPDIGWINTYLRGETGFITSWWWMGAYASVAALGFLIKWLLRKRSVKKL